VPQVHTQSRVCIDYPELQQLYWAGPPAGKLAVYSEYVTNARAAGVPVDEIRPYLDAEGRSHSVAEMQPLSTRVTPVWREQASSQDSRVQHQAPRGLQ
jgi:hypothetical protein